MKKTITTFLHSSACVVIVLAMTFVSNYSAAQQNDTSIYIPQITLEAAKGYGPYIAGAQQQNLFKAYDLPEQTSKAVFQFIDADSVPVGDSHVVTGSDLDTVFWNVQLYDLDLPLSPQFHLQLTYKSDSIADYYVAYLVYPDTVSLQASAGWGPFITNAYSFSDTTWQPVPQQLNTFTASRLPPRTYRVTFQILLADSTLFDSLTVDSQPGVFLQEAVYPGLRMDQLPLETRYLRALVYSHGGSPDGLDFHKSLSLAPQPARLISRSEGLVLYDSIAPFIENPAAGQALLVDSVKHAQITNGPGTQMFEWFRGPMSMDVIKGDFSVEAWIRLDLENIANNAQKEHEIMYVDSVFSISYVSEYGGTWSAFRLYAVVDGMYFDLYEAEFPNSALAGKEWHHFAFTLDGQYNMVRKFYLDGQPLATSVNDQNIQHIQLYYTDYDHALRTKPFLLGGRDNTEPSYVTAFDEVRFWHSCRTHAEILGNMNCTVLQDYFLRGYWNFDDRRNRLNFISDLSCSNNSGVLMNGATFIPENTGLFTIRDTIILYPSNIGTDSVRFAFLSQDGKVMDSATIAVTGGKARWTYDISTLPYTVGHLRTGEFCPGSPVVGFETLYNVHGYAPAPIATPQYNWGTYYQSDDGYGTINNPIVVTNFPDNTSKVELGLKKDNSYYNVDNFELNSVPFLYSLTLNGTDNYIQTSSQLSAPSDFQISLWFKTTSTKGGKLIGFTNQQSGTNVTTHDREIILEKDGAIRFNFIADGEVVSLFGANKYNDGEWHCVSVNLNVPTGVDLYMDGSVVDQTNLFHTESYNGYWVIGRNHTSGKYSRDAVAEFFEGSLAYISLWTNGKKAPDPSLLNGALRGTTLYKLDEGKGTQVNDSQGNNPATLEGSDRKWTKTSKISMVRWEHNMIDLDPGFYTFYARVYYAGGGEQGVYYPLGIFDIEDPLPGHGFSYDLSRGLGYFNEGVQMYNTLSFATDYDGSSDPDWKDNFVQYQYLSPAHDIIDHNIFTWTGSGHEGHLVIDMGEAPPGSYLNIQVGYNTIHNLQTVAGRFSLPVLIRPMMEPMLTGDFGPFDQAIAPGTMAHSNTFNIFIEGLSDLSKVTAIFYDQEGNEVVTTEGVYINDTLWQITQNMAELSPPVTDMKVYYYLGTSHYLAKVAGPYKIQIHKTRPDWFDFIESEAFSHITETSDGVTFQISTPFESSYLINNSSGMSIPNWVPLIGDSECEMEMPGATAHLKYIKSEGKLVLNQPPDFFQKVFNLGAGNPSTLLAAFNYSQNNSYELDDNNQLLARQNFSTGGSLTSGFDKMENIVKKLKEILLAVKVADPEKVIVSPSFEISYTGSFEYSSRLNMKVDTNTGKWGSYGNLKVDANPEHPEAYNNSASFQFYSTSAGMEFGIGAELLEGAVSAHFGVDARFVLGFGHSYVTIPSYAERPLKSFAFQTYGRFYVDVLWGWYEKTVWGPRMFYSTTIWGDDMTDAFPPAGKMVPEANLRQIPASSPLVISFHPASIYSLAQMPRSQSGVVHAGDRLLLSWLERGESFGQRQLSCQAFDLGGRHFMPKRTIEANGHAPNSLCANSSDTAATIHVWAQSRHTSGSFASDSPLEEFIRSQDIWYAVHDGSGDSLLQTGMLEDEVLTYTDGRAESKPQVVMLSPERALITWQVVELEIPQADIWYALLESDGSHWQQTGGSVAVQGEGVETQISLASPGAGQAVLAWLNTDRDEAQHSTIMSSFYNGFQWSEPVRVSTVEDTLCNYFDLEFHNGYGQLVYTVFVEDPVNGHYEKLKLVTWSAGQFHTEEVTELLTDSTHHMQLPALAISGQGRAVVAVKKEIQGPKDSFHKICQVDLLLGNLEDTQQPWQHIEAHPYVCDTTRQVSELGLAFTGTDSLLLLVQEYAMLGANAALQPQNGIVFGDPYMNLVLRCFALDEEGEVLDVDEHDYFLGMDEPATQADHFTLAQCYPNPCNEYTTLKFGVNRTAVVQIDLFDIQGVRKARLADQQLTAGIYEMVVSTASLAPGYYIIRLQQESSVRTVKLIVKR